MSRGYHLGRRQAAVDRTASSIVEAARIELQGTPARALSVGAVARRAGVTRATVYNRFGTREGLIRALVPASTPAAAVNDNPRDAVHEFLASRCARWALNPAFYRGLGELVPAGEDETRRLAEELARADRLRPGCSIKEAQDVLGVLSSFGVFDRLHQDGRRSSGACAEILMRLAGGILA